MTGTGDTVGNKDRQFSPELQKFIIFLENETVQQAVITEWLMS